MKAKDRAYLLIARKNGSSSSRRQRAFPDRAAVDRAIERWRGEGFNTWWLYGGLHGGVNGARALLKEWQDAPVFDYDAFGRAVATILKNTNRRAVNSDDAAERNLEAFDAILEEADDHQRSGRRDSRGEEQHPATGEPTNEARAARVDDAIAAYARRNYGNQADREDHATVAQDFINDVLHWVHQHGADTGDVVRLAVDSFQTEVAQEQDEEHDAETHD